MVGVKMRAEIGCDVLIGDLQRREVHLAAEAEVEDELVAVAQFDQPRGVRLPLLAERGDGARRRRRHEERQQSCV